MNWDDVLEFALLLILFAGSFIQAWITLRRTATWVFLGRGYLLYFVGKTILWAYVVLITLVGELSVWLLRAVEAEAGLTGIVLIVAMLRHDWPPPPDRIQWAGLFGWPWRKGKRR